MSTEPKVFVSYCSTDRAVVEGIDRTLKDQGLFTFFDRRSTNPGHAWLPDIEAALAKSTAVVVVLGRELGPIQNVEINYAIALQAQAKRRSAEYAVIPVLIDGFEEALPPGILGMNTLVDLRKGAGGDGLLRLIDACRGRVGSAEAPPTLQPYRGLETFREIDHPFFFGREQHTQRLLAMIATRRLIAVVGASGSGKSSLVAAGLLPKLREIRPRWECISFKPGGSPCEALASATVGLVKADKDALERHAAIQDLTKQLEAADGRFHCQPFIDQLGVARLLLFVDQMEELFTLVSSDAQRSHFMDILIHAIDDARVTVVLTLRADFFGHAMEADRRLSDLVEIGLVSVGPMTRSELRTAIEKPSQQVRFEPGLVDTMLDDAESEPGGLPLLQFALKQIWNEQRDGVILRSSYERLGELATADKSARPGLLGAVGKRAEEIFQGLDARGQAALLRVFTRLVRVSPEQDVQDVRQRVAWQALSEQEQKAAEEFVKERLLVKGRAPREGTSTFEETLDVAHEALIRSWDRLRKHLSHDERRFLRWRQRLDERRSEWLRSERDSGALLAGGLLREARRWSKRRQEDLSDDEKAFIALSSQRKWRSRGVVLAAGLILLSPALVAWRQMNARTIEGTGSGTVIDTLLRPAEAMLAECSDVRMQLKDTGSQAALAAVSSGDIGLMSDEPDPERVRGDLGLRGLRIANVLVGYDDITFIVNRANPIGSLPIDPLRDLLFGTKEQAAKAKWSALGVQDPTFAESPISLWVPRPESGTGRYLESALAGDRQCAKFVDLKRTELGPDKHVLSIAGDTHALGVVSSAAAAKNTGVRATPLSDASINLKRGLYFLVATKGDRVPDNACRVLRCLLSPAGQSELPKLKLSPAPSAVVKQQIDELGLGPNGSCQLRDPTPVSEEGGTLQEVSGLTALRRKH